MNYFNNNIATKSGIVGRFGRFFKFGSREYGTHYTTKYIKCLNSFLINTMAYFLHDTPMLRSIG